MIIYRAFDIQYDTDGDNELADSLPKDVIVELEDDVDPSIEIADKVSDKTGFCIFGCQFEVVGPNHDVEASILLNFHTLRQQKQTLLEVMNDIENGRGSASSKESINDLEGILCMIDAIQDQAAEQYGEDVVFGKTCSECNHFACICEEEY